MEAESPQTTTLDELYNYLRRFHVSDSLFIIGVINSIFKYGTDVLNREDIPLPAMQWVENDLPADRTTRMMLYLHSTRLARFLLLSGGNDYRDKTLDTGTPDMHKAIHLTSNLFDLEAEGILKDSRDGTRILGRLGQWQFPLQRDRAIIIGRAQMLFIEIPKELNLPYDMDAKMQEYFGMDVFQFIASGLALWMLANGVLKYKVTVEVDALKDVISQETVDKFIALSSGTHEDYRRSIRGDDWKTSNKKMEIYAPDPLAHMPIIKIERSLRLGEAQYVVPQPWYLLQRASTGIFYLLADKERDNAAALQQEDRQNDFRQYFGAIYRAYVGRHLGVAHSPNVFVDLDKELGALPAHIRKPDFALIEGDTCIIFEVKTGLLKLNARTLLDEETARSEIRGGNFKKALEQLESFEKAVIDGTVPDNRFKGVSRVVKVIVGFDDLFLANAFLLPIAREEYPGRVDNLQIAGLTDIESIGDYLYYDGSMEKLMNEKMQDPSIAEFGLAPFVSERTARTSNKPVLLNQAFEDFMYRATGGKAEIFLDKKAVD